MVYKENSFYVCGFFFLIIIMCFNSLMDWYNEVDLMNVNKYDGVVIFI